ncbi:hypothetical protein EV424DRAFT_373147 [Suillus variegatus]|nr:hypothetical protein EV424DRAFT_373147 [Suillus variegatus]
MRELQGTSAGDTETQVGHTDRSGSLNSLAAQLSSRFCRRGNDEDLDKAIAFHREPLALLLAGHTHRSSSLNNLANKLFTRFNHRGHDEDFDQAIARKREALVLLPVGYIDRTMSLNNLANGISFHFHHRGNNENLGEAHTRIYSPSALTTEATAKTRILFVVTNTCFIVEF